MPNPRKHVPLSNEILAAMKVSEGSVEAAHYFVERLTAILTETKMLDKSGDLLERAKIFAQYVDLKLNSNAQPWSGQMGKPSDFENMQDRIGDDAVKTVKASYDSVKLDIAINDKAQLLRGYSSEGKQISDPVIVDALDKIFNSWLAKNNVVTRDSVLYEADITGKIIHDVNGDVKANPEQIKKLMNDIDKGLTKFSKDKDFSFIVDNSHVYPAPPSETEKKATVPSVGKPEEVEPAQPKL